MIIYHNIFNVSKQNIYCILSTKQNQKYRSI